MKFTEFNFKDYINETLEAIKFVSPTPVQEKLIPVVMSGRDLVGESKTGSGKTHTFLLPIFQQLNTELDEVQAVITAPSRELPHRFIMQLKNLLNLMMQSAWSTMWVEQIKRVKLRNLSLHNLIS